MAAQLAFPAALGHLAVVLREEVPAAQSTVIVSFALLLQAGRLQRSGLLLLQVRGMRHHQRERDLPARLIFRSGEAELRPVLIHGRGNAPGGTAGGPAIIVRVPDDLRVPVRHDLTGTHEADAPHGALLPAGVDGEGCQRVESAALAGGHIPLQNRLHIGDRLPGGIHHADRQRDRSGDGHLYLIRTGHFDPVPWFLFGHLSVRSIIPAHIESVSVVVGEQVAALDGAYGVKIAVGVSRIHVGMPDGGLGIQHAAVRENGEYLAGIPARGGRLLLRPCEIRINKIQPAVLMIKFARLHGKAAVPGGPWFCRDGNFGVRACDDEMLTPILRLWRGRRRGLWRRCGRRLDCGRCRGGRREAGCGHRRRVRRGCRLQNSGLCHGAGVHHGVPFRHVDQPCHRAVAVAPQLGDGAGRFGLLRHLGAGPRPGRLLPAAGFDVIPLPRVAEACQVGVRRASVPVRPACQRALHQPPGGKAFRHGHAGVGLGNGLLLAAFVHVSGQGGHGDGRRDAQNGHRNDQFHQRETVLFPHRGLPFTAGGTAPDRALRRCRCCCIPDRSSRVPSGRRPHCRRSGG